MTRDDSAAQRAAQHLVTQRLAAQWLDRRRPASVVDVVRRLLAVQAQDLQGARLAIRARAGATTARDVDTALAERRLVVTWLNRGTLHLVAAEDYWWLHPLTAPRTMTANARRLAQEGVSPEQAERGVAVVTEAVRSGGPQTRSRLRERLAAAGVPTAGQALVHVLMAASLRGLVVRGPMQDGDQAYVSVPDWLGEPPPPPDRDEVLHRLARRYLTGHRPATPEDLAAWAGITLGDARRATALEAAEGAKEEGAKAEAQRRRSLPARLLGPFDPVLHGWPDRTWIVGPYRKVVTMNGIFRPVVLVGGRVVGVWGRPRGEVTLDLFEDVDAAVRTRLDADAADVHRFLTG